MERIKIRVDEVRRKIGKNEIKLLVLSNMLNVNNILF